MSKSKCISQKLEELEMMLEERQGIEIQEIVCRNRKGKALKVWNKWNGLTRKNSSEEEIKTAKISVMGDLDLNKLLLFVVELTETGLATIHMNGIFYHSSAKVQMNLKGNSGKEPDIVVHIIHKANEAQETFGKPRNQLKIAKYMMQENLANVRTGLPERDLAIWEDYYVKGETISNISRKFELSCTRVINIFTRIIGQCNAYAEFLIQEEPIITENLAKKLEEGYRKAMQALDALPENEKFYFEKCSVRLRLSNATTFTQIAKEEKVKPSTIKKRFKQAEAKFEKNRKDLNCLQSD